MKVQRIAAGEFKTHCLSLIEKVGKRRMALIITKHGKPFAKLVPLNEEAFTLYGCLQDTVHIHGNIVTGTEEAWEADDEN